MKTEQKQNKILFAGLVTLIFAGIFSYVIMAFDRTERVFQTFESVPIVSTEPETAAISLDTEPVRVSTLEWDKIKFDACDGGDKYSSLPWWEKFMAHAAKVDYYNDTYIWSVLKDIHEDTYRNPAKKIYSHDEFCASSYGNSSPICVGRYQKLAPDDFWRYGEGCLSRDGKGFVAVFPGEYMGGGNHIFRYDILEDAFEEAVKINETTPSNRVWVSPPNKFGKRNGDIIKMTGGSGDAGWTMKTEYDYNFVTNIVRIMSVCRSYDREAPDCESF